MVRCGLGVDWSGLVWVSDVWVSVGWLWDSVCWEWVGVVRCELVVGQCWLVNMYNHNF